MRGGGVGWSAVAGKWEEELHRVGVRRSDVHVHVCGGEEQIARVAAKSDETISHVFERGVGNVTGSRYDAPI